MPSRSQNLRLALHQSADGPRIVLFGPLDAPLERLHETFLTLSRGGGPIQLDREPFVTPVGPICLTAVSTGPEAASRRRRTRSGVRKTQADASAFEWRMSAEQWGDAAALLEGLLGSAEAGHQYFRGYPESDVIIVVSKGEYGDEALSG